MPISIIQKVYNVNSIQILHKKPFITGGGGGRYSGEGHHTFFAAQGRATFFLFLIFGEGHMFRNAIHSESIKIKTIWNDSELQISKFSSTMVN